MKNYISEIVAGNMNAFDELYKAYRMLFLLYGRVNLGLSHEDAVDLYQDVCTAVLNNIKTGRLKEDSLPDSSLRSYINQTGKFILYNRRRKKAVPLSFNTEWIYNLEDSLPEEEDDEKQEKLFIIRRTVELMPMPCSKLLELKIYKEKKNSEIAKIMNYANLDSTKSQLSKCKAKLEAIVKQRLKECGYEI